MCGFFAGVLGGAYGMNGPPLAIYGAMRGGQRSIFERPSRGTFFPPASIGMGGYWLAGLWTPLVTRYFLLSLPATLIAIFLGRAINHRMSGEGFLGYIYLMSSRSAACCWYRRWRVNWAIERCFCFAIWGIRRASHSAPARLLTSENV